MRVSIIGAGYVGLTTSVCLAELGHDVICADIDRERIRQLNEGELPFKEAGLDELLGRNFRAGRLRFTNDLAETVRGRAIVMIAVGTPKGADGEVDLSFVRNVAHAIAPLISPRTVITLKSTVAVGTARQVREIIAEKRKALDFRVTSNPEFLREGSAVEDFMKPDRIVIGADDHEAAAALVELYRPLLERGIPVVSTATADAELIKYAANALLALKIGFINDVSDLCEKIDGDITSVAKGVGLDRRIGSSFLSPGPGYGGSCFPKDTEAFAAIGRRFSAPQPLIETLIARNAAHRRRIADRVLKEVGSVRNPKVAVLGLAFKANTDDIREAAALTIIPRLTERGIEIALHDPWVRPKDLTFLSEARWCDDPYVAVKQADLVLILTEWESFRKLDLSRIGKLMRGRTVFDCRNLFEPEQVLAHGLRYLSLGRPDVPRTARKARPHPAEAQAMAPTRGRAV